MTRLLFVNNHQADLIVHLERLAPELPMHPKTQGRISVHVPVNGSTDLMHMLSTSKMDVQAMVDSSPEAQYYIAKGLLHLVDTDNIQTVEPMGASEGNGREHMPSQMAYAFGEQMLAPARVSKPVENSAEDVKKAEEEAMAAEIQSALVDNQPSSRWDREKLADYALGRGINVDGMSKNQILRKLRGA